MSVADEQINAAIDLLRANGFTVERPEYGPWEKPMELWLRVAPHLSYSGFYGRLTDFPDPFPARRGPSGRLIVLRTTPDLLAWLKRPAEPGKTFRP